MHLTVSCVQVRTFLNLGGWQSNQRQEPPVPTGLGGQSGPCEEVLPEAEATRQKPPVIPTGLGGRAGPGEATAAVDHRAAAGSWASARVVGLTGAFVSAFVVGPT